MIKPIKPTIGQKLTSINKIKFSLGVEWGWFREEDYNYKIKLSSSKEEEIGGGKIGGGKRM